MRNRYKRFNYYFLAMKQEEFNEIFRNRTKRLSLEIIRQLTDIPFNDAVGIMRKQLIRSTTSVAANFRAVCRARSEKERFAKLCIVVEEADETVFWIELFDESGFAKNVMLGVVKKEAEEILKVMSAFKKSMQKHSLRST